MPTTVFFDLETSGLDKTRHAIIQLAAVAVDGNLQPIDEFHQLVKFREHMADPKALELNHYDPKRWADEAITPQRCAVLFKNFLQSHADRTRISRRGSTYQVAMMAGHNTDSFDLPFLLEWFKRLNMGWIPADFKTLDTYSMAYAMKAIQELRGEPFLDVPNLRLETLCNAFGIEVEKAHDALSDVHANIRLAQELINRTTYHSLDFTGVSTK